MQCSSLLPFHVYLVLFHELFILCLQFLQVMLDICQSGPKPDRLQQRREIETCPAWTRQRNIRKALERVNITSEYNTL